MPREAAKEKRPTTMMRVTMMRVLATPNPHGIGRAVGWVPQPQEVAESGC